MLISNIRNMYINILGFLRMFGVNWAVFYGALSKIWFAVAGLITFLLIALYLSPQMQGYYFTFSSLLSLQLFVELGLTSVIINFTSHEWSKLSLDGNGMIIGDADAISRLRSLAKIVLWWYAGGALILFIILCVAGYLFFSHSPQVGISWILPWFALCCSAALNLILIPILSLLEGSNQVANIYFARFIQEVVRAFATWIIIIFGGGLWALTGAMLCMVIWTILYLFKRYRNYFRSLYRQRDAAQINWLKEMWPMQWRIAVSSLSTYFFFPLFVPVLFYFKGPVVAGQTGMTLAMASTLTVIASMWIVTRAPQFGMLTSKRDYLNLDKILFRSAAVATGVASIGAIIIYTIVSLLYKYNMTMASRILPPFPTALLLLVSIIAQINIAQVTSLRAHKKEPYMVVSVMSAMIMLILTIYAGSRWGALGIVVAYLCNTAFFGLPVGTIIWIRCRKAWRQDDLHQTKALPRGGLIT